MWDIMDWGFTMLQRYSSIHMPLTGEVTVVHAFVCTVVPAWDVLCNSKNTSGFWFLCYCAVSEVLLGSNMTFSEDMGTATVQECIRTAICLARRCHTYTCQCMTSSEIGISKDSAQHQAIIVRVHLSCIRVVTWDVVWRLLIWSSSSMVRPLQAWGKTTGLIGWTGCWQGSVQRLRLETCHGALCSTVCSHWGKNSVLSLLEEDWESQIILENLETLLVAFLVFRVAFGCRRLHLGWKRLRCSFGIQIQYVGKADHSLQDSNWIITGRCLIIDVKLQLQFSSGGRCSTVKGTVWLCFANNFRLNQSMWSGLMSCCLRYSNGRCSRSCFVIFSRTHRLLDDVCSKMFRNCPLGFEFANRMALVWVSHFASRLGYLASMRLFGDGSPS